MFVLNTLRMAYFVTSLLAVMTYEAAIRVKSVNIIK